MMQKMALRFWCHALLVCGLLWMVPCGRADSIYMKNGIVYRSMGQPDKDGTLVYMWDGLRKLVVRDSKIEKIVGDNSFRTGERFTLVQPLVVHAGVMPKEVISVQAGPWNDRGQRAFRYVGSRSNKPISMEQAIIEIGPHLVKFRGVNGFWQGALATSEIPRQVMMSLLARVEQQNQAERERVVRFLMDAGWYPEAKKELERVIHDFPNTDLSERARGARAFLVQAEATGRRSEIEVRKNAHQFRHVNALLKSFTESEIGTELVVEVRELSRRLEDQHAADLGLATDLRKLEGKLPAAARAAWKKRVARGDEGDRGGARRRPRSVRRVAESRLQPRQLGRKQVRPGDVWFRRGQRVGRIRPDSGRPFVAGPRPGARVSPERRHRRSRGPGREARCS